MKIQAVLLNAPDFKPYGQILTRTDNKPMADDEIITYYGKTALIEFHGKASTGYLIGHKRRFETDKLERHRNTPEVLAALEGDAVIIAAQAHVATGAPEDVKAFIVKQGQAIAFNKGVYHWTPFPVKQDECRFLVMFENDTESADLQILELDDNIEITFI